jgi:hypothetical protein
MLNNAVLPYLCGPFGLLEHDLPENLGVARNFYLLFFILGFSKLHSKYYSVFHSSTRPIPTSAFWHLILA